VPVSVAQTSLVGSIAHGWSYNATVDGYSHTYYVALFFAEVDPSVNASGLRVFDVTINGESFSQGIDVYYQVGLDKPYEIYTYPGALIGPYSSIVINGTANSTSVFPPFIAGAEILQLLDDPMAPPTHPVDGKKYSNYSLLIHHPKIYDQIIHRPIIIYIDTLHNLKLRRPHRRSLILMRCIVCLLQS
jgi:hypothetical protein